MEFKALTRELSKGIVKPVYLFYGPERLLLEESIELLKEKLVEGASQKGWNYYVVYGKEVKATTILEKARTLPFFAGHRLILIQEADSLPWAEQEKLIPYLQAPVSFTCLVLIGDTSAPLAQLEPYIKAKGAIVEFSTLSPGEVLRWIKEKVEGFGYKITPEAGRYLLENNGPDLLQIKSELDKAIAFTGKSGSWIELKDLQELCWHATTHTIFDLVAALGNRKKEEALYLLQCLLRQNEAPLLILNLIVRHFRQLWQIKDLQANNYSIDQVGKLLGLLPYRIKKYLDQASKFSWDELKDMFASFLEIDLLLKSTDIPGKILLENFIWRLA